MRLDEDDDDGVPMFARDDVIAFMESVDMSDLDIMIDAISCKIEEVEQHRIDLDIYKGRDEEMRGAALRMANSMLAKLQRIHDRLVAWSEIDTATASRN